MQVGMSENAMQGMELFYEGDSNGHSCAECHSGLYQTDLRPDESGAYFLRLLGRDEERAGQGTGGG